MRSYNILVWGLNAMELISAVFAFSMYQQHRSAKWRLFPFYLLLIFLFEMAGRVLASESEWMHLNALLFNYLCFPVQFLFFFFMLNKS